MGLLAGFVFPANRRVVLATLAVAVSVTYSLVAAATITGLRDAQENLSADLQTPQRLLVRGNLEPFDLQELPERPDAAVAVVRGNESTYYVVRLGEGGIDNASFVAMGPSAAYSPGAEVVVAGQKRQVKAPPELGGIAPDWLGVDESTFRSLGGPPAPLVQVAAYRSLAESSQLEARKAGFTVVEAPATKQFYEGGTNQLVSSVWTTVVASTVVVGVVTSGFLLLELQAIRKSIATLRMFAGAGLVTRIILLRGIALLVAGHALALVGSYGLIFFLKAAHVFTFSLPWAHVRLASMFTLFGGLAGTIPALSALRGPVQSIHLRGTSIPRRAPRILRFTLASWRSLFPLAAAATILAATLAVVFGTLGIPGQVFGQFEGEEVISAEASGNPLRTTVSAFLGLHLDEVKGWEATSPEIFVPTSINGRPVLVRGVSWPNFEKLEHPRLVKGTPPRILGDAVVGSQIARLEGIEVGDSFVVPASYTPSLVVLHVTGIAHMEGILQDEVLVTLSTARSLTGLRTSEVNLIRVRFDPGAQETPGTGMTIPTRIEVVGLRLVPDRPVANETATVYLDLVNFGGDQSRTLTVRVNGAPHAELTVSMPGKSTRTEQVNFRVPSTSLLSIEVNPRIDVPPDDPAYRIEAPEVAPLGSPVQVAVFDLEGKPASGVRAELVNASGTADDQGQLELPAETVGDHTILIEGPAGRAARPILVVLAEDQDTYRLHVREIVGPSRIVAGTWQGAVLVENVGGKPFSGPLPLLVDGNATHFSETILAPFEPTRIPISIELSLGLHQIGDANFTFDINVTNSAPQEPPQTTEGPSTGEGPSTVPRSRSLEELLEARRGRIGQGVASPQDAVQAFLGQTYANLDAAVTLVTFATVLHSGLIVFTTVQRGIEERAVNVGTLAVLGADRRALRHRVLREYGVLAVVAAFAGTMVGLGLTWAATYLGFLNGFGHALHPRINLDFTLRLAVVSALTLMGAAIVVIENVRSRNIRQLLSQGPSRRNRPELHRLLEGPP